MNTELPSAAERFVTAMNAQDVAAFTACFTPDAFVEDEGHTHHGLTEIAAWISRAFASYQPVLEVSSFEEKPDEWIISGMVSGTFPGSPILLHYHLRMSGEGLIQKLRCAA